MAAICSRSKHLALAGVERLRVRAPISADRRSTYEPVTEQCRDLVHPRHQVDGLEDFHLLGRRGIEIGHREIGQQAGRGRRLDGLAQFGRHARQQVERLANLLAKNRSGPYLGAGGRRPGDEKATRHQERISGHELGDAEALHALADQVMAALRAGDVAADINTVPMR